MCTGTIALCAPLSWPHGTRGVHVCCTHYYVIAAVASKPGRLRDSWISYGVNRCYPHAMMLLPLLQHIADGGQPTPGLKPSISPTGSSSGTSSGSSLPFFCSEAIGPQMGVRVCANILLKNCFEARAKIASHQMLMFAT